MNEATFSVKQIIENDLWIPASIRPEGEFRFLECTPRTFTDSAFLDRSRIQGTTGRQVAVKYDELEPFLPAAPENIAHIFHISHVGSTLVAKVLGDLPGVRVFREPSIIRELVSQYLLLPEGSSPFSLETLNDYTYATIRLLGRGSQAKTIIKHTSHNNLIVDKLLFDEKPRALGLYTSLENFLAHAGRSDGTRDDVYLSMGTRLKYLNKHSDFYRLNLADLDYWEMAACLWIAEMHKLCAARLRFENLQLVNFDEEMHQQKHFVKVLCQALGFSAGEATLSRLLDSPEWGNASKSSGRDFDYSDRVQKIADARLKDHFYIQKALDFAWEFCDQNATFVPLIQYLG